MKAARDLSLAEVTACTNAGQLLIRLAFIKEKVETTSRKKGTHFSSYISRDILRIKLSQSRMKDCLLGSENMDLSQLDIIQPILRLSRQTTP